MMLFSPKCALQVKNQWKNAAKASTRRDYDLAAATPRCAAADMPWAGWRLRSFRLGGLLKCLVQDPFDHLSILPPSSFILEGLLENYLHLNPPHLNRPITTHTRNPPASNPHNPINPILMCIRRLHSASWLCKTPNMHISIQASRHRMCLLLIPIDCANPRCMCRPAIRYKCP